MVRESDLERAIKFLCSLPSSCELGGILKSCPVGIDFRHVRLKRPYGEGYLVIGIDCRKKALELVGLALPDSDFVLRPNFPEEEALIDAVQAFIESLSKEEKAELLARRLKEGSDDESQS